LNAATNDPARTPTYAPDSPSGCAHHPAGGVVDGVSDGVGDCDGLVDAEGECDDDAVPEAVKDADRVDVLLCVGVGVGDCATATPRPTVMAKRSLMAAPVEAPRRRLLLHTLPRGQNLREKGHGGFFCV